MARIFLHTLFYLVWIATGYCSLVLWRNYAALEFMAIPPFVLAIWISLVENFPDLLASSYNENIAKMLFFSSFSAGALILIVSVLDQLHIWKLWSH